MMIRDLDLLCSLSLNRFTARETQQACLKMSETILAYLEGVLFKRKLMGQLHVIEYRSVIRQYLSYMGEVLKLQETPNPVHKIWRAHMYFETSTGTTVQHHMEMTRNGFKTVGPYCLLDLLLKLITATSIRLSKEIKTPLPDCIIMTEQCLKESRRMDKLLFETVDREFPESIFLIDPYLILYRVILQVEILDDVEIQVNNE